MVLGGFDLEAMGDRAMAIVTILFFMCTLFNMIVMLNLLIAIISETFANVNENAEWAGFQERAKIVAENAYLVNESEMKAHCQPGQLLISAVNKDDLVQK